VGEFLIEQRFAEPKSGQEKDLDYAGGLGAFKRPLVAQRRTRSQGRNGLDTSHYHTYT